MTIPNPNIGEVEPGNFSNKGQKEKRKQWRRPEISRKVCPGDKTGVVNIG